MLRRILITVFEFFGFCWHIWNYFIDEDAAIHPSTRKCIKCDRTEIFHDGREKCCETGWDATGWKKLSTKDKRVFH